MSEKISKYCKQRVGRIFNDGKPIHPPFFDIVKVSKFEKELKDLFKDKKETGN